jgi:hypothetical protein
MLTKTKKSIPYLILLILSLSAIYPFIGHLKGVAVDDADSLLMIWIYNQNIQKIPGNLINLFQGNIFYPYKNIMAYSDLHFLSSLLAYISVKLTKEPSVSLSSAFIFGQLLTATVVYKWWEELTKDKWAAALGALALTVSQIRLGYPAHMQMWNMQYFIFSAYMYWKYRKVKKLRYLNIGIVTTALLVWESPLQVYFSLFTGAVILLPEIKGILVNWTRVLPAVFVAILVSLPVAFTYWSVSNEFNYQRTIRDAANFSIGPDDFFGPLFSPGLYVLALAGYITGKLSLKQKNTRWLVMLLLTGFVMSLGPVLKWHSATFKIFGKIFIPLPYGVLYYILPGFGAFRTPSRWIWLAALALSGLIAYGISRAKDKKELLILGFIVAFLGGTMIKSVMHIPTINEYPKVYGFLKDQPGDVVIELPSYARSGSPKTKIEFYRMLYSLKHKKHLVNGTSGFSPPEWEKLVSDVREQFPKDEAYMRLKKLGVNYVVIERSFYEERNAGETVYWGGENTIYVDESFLVTRIN